MQRSLQYGLIMLLLSSVLLSICLSLHWTYVFFMSVLAAGMGHGLCLMGAFSLIYHMTQAENRAAVIATYLFIAYWGSIVPIVMVGFLADWGGFNVGVLSFCGLMGLLCTLLLYKFRQYF